MSEVIVYGVPGSPYVRSVLLGLEEKGARYRLHALRLGEGKAPEHLARHPFGRIPSISHDGYELYETQAIIRYVDAAFPGLELQPRDPRSAGRMNQIVGVVDWYIFQQVTAVISYNRLLAPLLGQTTDEDAIAAAVPNAVRCLDALERLRGTSRFLVGEAISIADLMLAPQLAVFATIPEGERLLRGRPLADWLTMMNERSSMRATTREQLTGQQAA